jgi:hypothetical protein
MSGSQRLVIVGERINLPEIRKYGGKECIRRRRGQKPLADNIVFRDETYRRAYEHRRSSHPIGTEK